MKIVVCVRRGLDGEINPFDACAYEAALQQRNAEVILLSMGPEAVKDFLTNLTRLGAGRAILLCDKLFAGADTLATAYTLSVAINKLKPDAVFCGRQTLVGDTGQVGPMLAQMLGFSLITNVMSIEETNKNILCSVRSGEMKTAEYPALLTIEKINKLRLPALRSKTKECEIWSAADIDAKTELCGLIGSPTRVLETFENKEGRRKCRFISRDMLPQILQEELDKKTETQDIKQTQNVFLSKVICVGEAPLEYAKTICKEPQIIRYESYTKIASYIEASKPDAVLFGSDDLSKKLAAQVAAKLRIGLCADCTRLTAEKDKLIMYRPALSGSIIAKIESLTKPALATVRTTSADVADVIVAAGFGVKDKLDSVKQFADELDADFATTRKMVDNDFMPYSSQVGLTGKTVAPAVYIAIGISGAVHHIAGMQKAKTVIAINPDKDAPIFDYADYGILEEFN